MHLNAKLIQVDFDGLQKSHLEFSCDFGEESVYVRGLWSMLAIFLCIATYSCINLRSDDDTAAQIALKLINRKRNQHHISVIIYLFIYSFLAFALQTVRLSYVHLQSLLEVRKDIYIYTMNTFSYILPTSLQYTNRIVFHLLELHEPH